MADSAADLAALVLRQVTVLLGELGPADVRDLAAGRKRVALVDVPAGGTPGEVRSDPAGTDARVARNASGLDPEEVRAAVMALGSRDEAARYVGELGTVPVLKKLATAFGVRLTSQDRRADVIRKIVDGTLGMRLTSEAVRGVTS